MVYFIQGEQTKLIKIGRAGDILVRLQQLQCGSPDRLMVLAVAVDAYSDTSYHIQFAAARVHGEWFKPSAEVMAFIEDIPASKFDGLSYITEYERMTRCSGCGKWRCAGKVERVSPCTCDDRDM